MKKNAFYGYYDNLTPKVVEAPYPLPYQNFIDLAQKIEKNPLNLRLLYLEATTEKEALEAFKKAGPQVHTDTHINTYR